MKTLALPLEFKEFRPEPVPKDEDLYRLTLRFCMTELAELPDFELYRKMWVTVELDKAGKMVRVTGMQALMSVVDLPISRYTNSKAAKLLSERVDSYLADQGLRGVPVFVFISSKEKPEQKCRDWTKWLRIWKAEPADRWLVRVR